MRKGLALVLAFLLFLPSAFAEDYIVPSPTLECIGQILDEFGVHVMVAKTLPEEACSYYYDTLPVVQSEDEDKAFWQRIYIYRAVLTVYQTLPLFPAGFLDVFDGNLRICLTDEILVKENGIRLGGYCKDDTRPAVWLVMDYRNVAPYVVIHECWHAFEGYMDLQFDNWDALNPEGFQYSYVAGQEEAFDPEWFYRPYGVVDPREERATLFEGWLLDTEEYWQAHPHIRAKLEKLLQMMDGALAPQGPEGAP